MHCMTLHRCLLQCAVLGIHYALIIYDIALQNETAVALLLQEAFTDPQFVVDGNLINGFTDGNSQENADKCTNVSLLLMCKA